MDVIAIIGRIVFVLIFLSSGVNHLMNTSAMAGYAESKQIPAARAAVIASGLWILVGALLVLLGVWGDLGTLMLFVFLLATAALFHGFWTEADPAMRQNEMLHFLKDVSLAGASLLAFVLYSEEAIGPTITGPLFG
ncbi:DoxX family membrane protein [Allosalinactinospora lopnorensis]|uniref:DoxX family membrane protein n=1 Tax=Allosalinactinospora lopnorensis TaxID=1352348 RepID=UPI000623D3CC|nr:DoxX family membrane protein [Allosalinactinospora lopnorensis]